MKQIFNQYWCLLFLFTGITFNTAYAQVVQYTLEAAVDSALNNNDKIKQYRYKVSEKDELNSAAVGNYLPSIGVKAGYSYFSDDPRVNMSQVKGSIDEVAGMYGADIAKTLGLSDQTQEALQKLITGSLNKLPAYDITIDQQQYPNLNIVAVQPIYTGGKITAAKRYAKANHKLSQTELKTVRDEIVKETVDRYLSAALLKRVVATRKEVLEGMKHHGRDAQKAIEVGLIAPHQILRAQVAIANAERDLDDDLNKLSLAKLALKTSMGLDMDEELDPADSLVYYDITIVLDSLKNEAHLDNPVFAMIDQKKVMVAQKHALELSEFLPQIGAFGSYNFFREEYPVIPPRFIIGVQMNINLFHGLKDYHGLQASKYLKKEIEQAEVYAHKQIDLLINKSYRDVINYKTRYEKFEPTLKLAEKNYKINEKRFREGMAKSTDVIDARLLYEGAQLQRLFSLYQYYQALVNLYVATGHPHQVVNILKGM
jgi:outer membrane protein TolC